MSIKESNGKYNGIKIYCPCEDCECPYFEDGICYIEDPVEECGDFGYDSWEDWEAENAPLPIYFTYKTYPTI